MQKANILLNNGNRGESVIPKYGVTPSEALVLDAIHGGGSVMDVEVLSDPAVDNDGRPLTGRADIQRLYEVYGAAKGTEDKPIVARLFPGAGARALETFDELGWEEDRFKIVVEAKPKGRKKAAAAQAEDDQNGNDGASALS